MNALALQDRFRLLLWQHVQKLTIRGNRATGLAPCHEDRSPSFSANLEQGVWYCHTCGKGGGVKDFAQLVGEEWGSSRSESRAAKARRARFQAEQQARAILRRRAEERDLRLCAEHRDLHEQALSCADVLSLFHRHPDLGAEFADVFVETESEYGDTLFRLTVVEAKLNGEVAA